MQAESIPQVTPTTLYTDDGVYTSFSKPSVIDKDTRKRVTNVIAAASNGVGTLTSPLNGPNTQRTSFVVRASGANKIRWDTLCLRVSMVFTKWGDTTHAAPSTGVTDADAVVLGMPFNSPSWNMVFNLISSVSLKMNNAEVYNSSQGSSYANEVTARLFRYFSYEALNSMGTMLFTPVGSQEYMIGSARPATVLAPTGAIWQAIKPTNYDSISCPYFGFTKADPIAAASTFAGFTPDYNPNAKDALLKERARRWCSGDTHCRVITMEIPMIVLTPIITRGIIKNLNELVLDITWSNSLDHLEHTAINADETSAGTMIAATWGQVCVTACDLVTDSYTPSVEQFATDVKEKTQGVSDIIEMHKTSVARIDYSSGSDITISNMRNLQAVYIMQPARGFYNHLSSVGTAADKRMYQSTGEFLLFGNSNNDAAAMKHHASEALANANSCPISSVQLEIGGEFYPSSPITIAKSPTSGTTAADLTMLYDQYLKSIAKLGRRDLSPAVPYWMFSSTCPFIAISPCPDNGSTLTREGKNLTIHMTGGTSNALPSNAIYIITFEYKAYRINPDGTCEVIDQ